MIGAVLAGPEPISAKDKNPIVEVPTTCDPRWYVSVGGNAEFNFGGNNFNNGAHEHFAIPQTADIDVDLQSHDYNDVYNNPFYSIEGELGYVLTRHIELFGTFRYSASPGSDWTSGSTVFIDVPQNFTGTFPVRSKFGDFNSYGGELGFRYFFLPKETRLRPYFSLSGGASYVSSINVQTHADASSVGGPSDVTVFKGAFFDDSWVGTGAALLGLEYSMNCHWVLGLNAGVRYQSELQDSDRDLNRFNNGGTAPFDISFINKLNDNAGDRWSVPITGYIKFRF
jgi:hypothetical protein